MTLSDYIDLLRGLGRAQKTIDEYTKYVRRMMVWTLQHGHDPDTIPAHEVRSWADAEIPMSWASRKQARTALAHYWRDRHDRPWEAIRVPRKPRPAYTGLPPEKATLLKQAAELVGGRSGLATLCGLYTGARAGEIAGMHHDHISGGTIRWWRSKTSEWQIMPLHPALEDAIGEGTGHLFVGNNGVPHVTASTVWSWVRKVAATAGLEVTPKQLRSTAGMMVLEATGDLDAAATFLGHRSVDTTRQHYVRTSQRRIEAAVAALDY